MGKESNVLLALDGMINLFLGILLLAFPLGVGEFLGMPPARTHFYSSLLGAVLIGIGAALAVEIFSEKTGIRGLGLGGAIGINVCGAGALAIWLSRVPLDIPVRGFVVLWSIAIIVLAVAVAEVASKAKK